MKLYIAGPMTNYPSFNIPAFDRMAQLLRSNGYPDVVSPAELDDPEIRAISMASPDGSIATLESHGQTHGDFLARDVKLIADGGIEGIVVLDGWMNSKGARWETFCGHLNGLSVYTVQMYPVGTSDYDISLRRVPILTLILAWSGLSLRAVGALVENLRQVAR